VAIGSLTANGKRYASLTDLRLPAPTRDLEISYTALSLTIPERVRFRYQLVGSDKNWQDAGTRRQAFYTILVRDSIGSASSPATTAAFGT
jgi:hypothetical protein